MTDEQISIEDFGRLSMKVAEVRSARPHPNADKLVVMMVETGSGEKQLVAGLKGHYEPESLVGRKIVIVDNLKPAKLRGEESEGMLLAATDPESGSVRLLSVDGDVPAGSAVT